jgi:sulfate adenylyltransferase large subunit
MQNGQREVLRFAAVGSVDDGKSTLIGRLLIDTRSVYDDQLEAIQRTSRQRGDEYLDLALLTDGLRAEREQGITIDVAYRYFSTDRRSFVIADCPGHVQYTRNMVSGCSTADLVLVLVDARQGVLEQTRRHATIASLMRVPHVVVCVNKMDLVDHREAVYERIRDEFTAYAARLGIVDVTFIPMSALHGDNVAQRSERMSWYEGPSLLYHLEHVYVASDRDLVDVRFPVQTVVRPRSPEHLDYRGYAGSVAGGVMRVGDRVVVLPSGIESDILAIDTYDGAVGEAFPPMSVTIRLASDVDVSRGDVIARPLNRPHVGSDIDAMICSVADVPIASGRAFTLMQGTRTTRALVERLRYRLDIDSQHRDEDAKEIRTNEIGRVRLKTAVPLVFDEYRRNRATGSFILVDEQDNRTLAAGMILGPAAD